jgi:hypothetical protein
MELKTCFGHKMSSSIHNQMKFKGYVYNDEGYQSVNEGLWLVLLQFSKKSKLVIFKDLGGAQ